MIKKQIAIARVRVTLEINVEGVWGQDTSLAQVHKQAKDSADSIIGDIIQSNKTATKIVGKPVIEAVIIPDHR